MEYDTEIQDLIIFNSKHIAYCMSPAPDKPQDEGSGPFRLILGFPESVEAPKDASENGLGEARLLAISLYFIFCIFLCYFVISLILFSVQRRTSGW